MDGRTDGRMIRVGIASRHAIREGRLLDSGCAMLILVHGTEGRFLATFSNKIDSTK